MQHFTRSYARSTRVRPVSDLDISIVIGPPGTGKTTTFLAELASRLSTKLDKYYDKTATTVVEGVPDTLRGWPDTFKIAVGALKAHRLGSIVEGRRASTSRLPGRFVSPTSQTT